MGSPNTLTVQLNHLYVELTMSTINRGVRTASRTLRTPALQSRAPLRTPLAFTSRANFTASPRTTPSSHRQFSVMAARQSGAPPPPQAREYDPEIKDIASYVHNTPIDSDLAFDTARFVFLDTLGCGLEGLRFKECTKLLGPIVEGTVVPNGTKVPGTPFQLDPVNGAFNIGAMIRWLDYNDCWLAAEWATLRTTWVLFWQLQTGFLAQTELEETWAMERL